MKLEPVLRDPVPKDQGVLRQIARRAAIASGASKVILFGSVARGEATKNSDLDLLLVFEDKVLGSSLLDAFGPVMKADDAVGPRRWTLDLLPMHRSEFEGGASILARVAAREGVILYG